jgi:hypothetical protein
MWRTEMALTTFVLVERLDFGDLMNIPVEVQRQYPDKFRLVVEEEDKKEVKVVVASKKGKK